ncbi:MAG: electron transfer flavoprotein subunit beta/FixA family protein [Chloroflexi bacterium]|nr:electron transfer flavoprotein subunit beta/FixA family protein [Chloroflexota bacterium]
MRTPHIAVCLKVVPRPEEVKVNLETRTLDRANARQQFNPPDVNALEFALALREKHVGRVSVLSMGPPFFAEYLKLALAVGADTAYLLSDRAFGGADTLPTSYTLARGIAKLGDCDLVVCGEESSDGATAQVPPGIAEWLGMAQVTYGSDLEILPERWRLKARRELKGGHEVITVPLPAVVSVRVGANEPRFIDFARLTGEPLGVTVWSAADLGVDPAMVGLSGSATVVAGVDRAETVERRRELLTGTPEEKARTLVERIAVYLARGTRPDGAAASSPAAHA